MTKVFCMIFVIFNTGNHAVVTKDFDTMLECKQWAYQQAFMFNVGDERQKIHVCVEELD